MRLVIAIGVLIISIGSYLVYPRYFSPIYIWETNIPTSDGGYVTSRLLKDELVFNEIKIADPPTFFFGRQIGRTKDGMRIYKLNGDSEQLMLTGFMFPQIFYERQR